MNVLAGPQRIGRHGRERGAILSGEEAKITLGVLNAVEANSAVTQRTVSRELGIALGLTNAYLKRCVRKGLIKVKQVPANRYAYFLTPKGFSEKSRLTAEYLAISFNFFRGARGQCAEVFDHCQLSGWQRIVFAGLSDLTEIAALCAADRSVAVVAVYEPGSSVNKFLGMPVVGRLDVAPPFDAVVVTDLRNPQGTFDRLVLELPPSTVVAPRLLAISRKPPTFAA